MADVDWQRLAAAMRYYTNRGWTQVDADSIVAITTLKLTMPPQGTIISVDDQFGLVASGEQSLLDRYVNYRGFEGRFVTCTPCYRQEDWKRVWEDGASDLYRSEFMKVELFQNVDVTPQELARVIALALDFFTSVSPLAERPVVVPTDDGFDINLGGIEIGSYGIREAGSLRWIYGTGLAEPRFSAVRNRLLGLRHM